MTDYKWILLPAIIFLISSCNGPVLTKDEEPELPEHTTVIFPDYKDITIPVNIAPLNFEVREDGKRFFALLRGENGPSVQLKAKQRTFRIPRRKWTRFLELNRGSCFTVKIYKKDAGDWTACEPFVIRVADEPIDPYLVYRLIPPGYETWSDMGLYERDLTSFRERPVVENRNIEDNCVNCHSFNNGSSEQMLFHIRGSVGGTMIKMGDDIEKVDLKRDETLSAGVYPAWHPSGNYIAFSTNIFTHVRRSPSRYWTGNPI